MNNKICVTMLLDAETTQTITDLQRALGRTETAAHITVATYENIDPQLIMEYAKEFAGSHKKLDIQYTGVGVMPGVKKVPPFLYAIPKVTKELINMFEAFHQKYDEKCIKLTSVHAKWWTPHTSLGAYSKEGVDICVNRFSHLYGKIVALRVVDVKENEYVTLGIFDLQDE